LLCGHAQQAGAEAQDGQAHAAAAAEFASLHPGREPATAEDHLIFQVVGLQRRGGGQFDTLDPTVIAQRADPFAEGRGDIAAAAEMQLVIGALQPGGRAHALRQAAIIQALDLDLRRFGAGHAGFIVAGEEHAGAFAGDAQQHRIAQMAQPAIARQGCYGHGGTAG
jgi:hypothetical protein